MKILAGILACKAHLTAASEVALIAPIATNRQQISYSALYRRFDVIEAGATTGSDNGRMNALSGRLCFDPWFLAMFRQRFPKNMNRQ